jgi:hypothetical protein
MSWFLPSPALSQTVTCDIRFESLTVPIMKTVVFVAVTLMFQKNMLTHIRTDKMYPMQNMHLSQSQVLSM